MSVEDFASSQVMIRYGEDIAKDTGWYLSEYSDNSYSWNSALGLCNTNLSWFCSLALSLYLLWWLFLCLPVIVGILQASVYGQLFLSLWILLLVPLWFLVTTCGLLIPKSECPSLTAPLSSRPVCTTICWTFPLHDPQGSLNSVNVNKFGRLKVLTEGGELGKVEERVVLLRLRGVR